MRTSWYARGTKRVLDVAASSLALGMSWPVLAAVAVAVRSQLGAPVLFRQPRPGRGGRTFTILKFRTMTDARDARGRLLSDDARLTPLGRWLRRTSVDELPELFNVLRGDMSLVGPRPLLERYRPYYTERERLRERVRPGITGLAQVRGRNQLSWDARLEADARYVETLSLRTDLGILAQTARAVFTARGVETDAPSAMLDLDAQRRHASARLDLRPLGPEHARALVALHRAAFDEHELQTTIFSGHGVGRYYADILEQGGEHRALGAFKAGALVGYAHVRQREGVSHLNQLAITPRAQGRGVGRQLLEAWIDAAQQPTLSLDVRDGSRASAWYRRRGFCVRRRSVLWRIPAGGPGGASVRETEDSQRWQRRYGFSTVVAEVGGHTHAIGRLGAHDLRIDAALSPQALDALRGERRLLVLGSGDPPHPRAQRLHTLTRMEARRA